MKWVWQASDLHKFTNKQRLRMRVQRMGVGVRLRVCVCVLFGVCKHITYNFQ